MTSRVEWRFTGPTLSKGRKGLGTLGLKSKLIVSVERVRHPPLSSFFAEYSSTVTYRLYDWTTKVEMQAA